MMFFQCYVNSDTQALSGAPVCLFICSHATSTKTTCGLLLIHYAAPTILLFLCMENKRKIPETAPRNRKDWI